MDAKEFREFGKAAIDYIADYLENIRDDDVLPNVEPGYLLDLLPTEMPEEPEAWKDVLGDISRVITINTEYYIYCDKETNVKEFHFKILKLFTREFTIIVH